MPSDLIQTLTETRNVCIKMQVSLAALNKNINDLLFTLKHPVYSLCSYKDPNVIAHKLAVSLNAFADSFEEFAEVTKPFTEGEQDE